VNGQWAVDVDYVCGKALHGLVFEQKGPEVGTHSGEFLSGDLRGTVEGNQLRFRSSHRHQGIRLSYNFTGTRYRATISGALDPEERGNTTRTTQRRRYSA
jgi:hypothetical protein